MVEKSVPSAPKTVNLANLKKGIDKFKNQTTGLMAPKDIPMEKVIAMMNYVVDDKIMQAAIGKDAKIKPGSAVLELMKQRINWVE